MAPVAESYHPACRPAVAGQLVELQVQVPRLRCNHASCPQVIFAERLPAVMLPRARRTMRPREALTSLGLQLGGEPGSRLAKVLASRRAHRRRLAASPATRCTRCADAFEGGHLRKGSPRRVVIADRDRGSPRAHSGLASRPARHNLGRAMTLPQILDRTPRGEPGRRRPPQADSTPVRLPFDNTYARLPERFYARVGPTPVPRAGARAAERRAG